MEAAGGINVLLVFHNYIHYPRLYKIVIHVKDEETDMLVRRLAESRRVGITTAIKDAVKDALARQRSGGLLWDETADIRAMLADYPRTGLVADKAFYDALSGHEASGSGQGED